MFSIWRQIVIYSIICLKSVDVRTMQFVFLAHSPREMSQTDRIHPRYFLLWIRVSIRPRYFVNAKKPIPGQTSPRPGRMLQRHRPSERRNLKRRLYLHARWRLTSAAGGYEWFCWHPCKTTRLRKSYPRCNDPAKRGSVCEAFEKKQLPLALTLLLRYR